jgi:hypothetical protein
VSKKNPPKSRWTPTTNRGDTRTIEIHRQHLCQAVDEYLTALRMINTTERVVDVDIGYFGDVYVELETE